MCALYKLIAFKIISNQKLIFKLHDLPMKIKLLGTELYVSSRIYRISHAFKIYIRHDRKKIRAL